MSDAEWVREPRQARSQATLERFVEATGELLEERSFEQITVADIVSTAERTVGSFYARFEDKYAVLHVLVERHNGRVRDVVHAFCDPIRWEDVSVAEFVAQSVALNVSAYRRSSALFRAALTAAATDDRFRASRRETMQFCAEQQKRFLLSRVDELSCSDPARASDLMFELVAATLDHELLFGRFTTTAPLVDGQLVRELTDQCMYVLGVSELSGESQRLSPELLGRP
jgi:AcrR family transcriptional regulator